MLLLFVKILLNLVSFKKLRCLLSDMKQELITIPKVEYELLLEEVGILRNPKIAEAIEENDRAKVKGVKTWKLEI